MNFHSAQETQSLNSNVEFLGLFKKKNLYAQDGNDDDEHEAKIDFSFFSRFFIFLSLANKETKKCKKTHNLNKTECIKEREKSEQIKGTGGKCGMKTI